MPAYFSLRVAILDVDRFKAYNDSYGNLQIKRGGHKGRPF